jgi:DNA polymerase/3'-5' exonuclease PolX
MLDRLRGESDTGVLLASVPGIGKVLAARLHDELDIHTLEQLEAAALDGRLKESIGLGEKQCTVITSQRGPLTGKRIVRGREDECAKHYQTVALEFDPAADPRAATDAAHGLRY